MLGGGHQPGVAPRPAATLDAVKRLTHGIRSVGRSFGFFAFLRPIVALGISVTSLIRTEFVWAAAWFGGAVLMVWMNVGFPFPGRQRRIAVRQAKSLERQVAARLAANANGRWCPECGAEYLAHVSECADCRVGLVDAHSRPVN